ncbi:MAG: threonylcarbamoyl-AMP synthase [Fibrobacter sp.]|jgi:tRNA threonylcarbamoyl adenosine modification protein (Sua5/YciO/YrdC/YwlC family)|nr:threonylcarbamoyl-AMP synthase [Fibrobacter sp.]
MRLEIHPENPQSRFVQQAATVLEKDGLVLYPTESGYAIGCNADSIKAIHKLYALKKPMKKFLMALILPGLKQATDFAHVSNFAFDIMKSRIPGPYTFILPANPQIARKLDVKRTEIGVRFPTHPFFKELFMHTDIPILSTAAKISENEQFTNPDDLYRVFGHLVDLMIDCGEISINPTNVIRIDGREIEVIRGTLD